MLNRAIGPLGYGDYWYAYLANGVLVYYLSIVGLQANFASAVPLRFEPEAALRDVEALPENVIETAAPRAYSPVATTSPVAHASGFSDEPARSPAPALAPEFHSWRAKLLQLMAEAQPWLEPELTLAELAHRLRTNTSLLSHVINTGCGQNFNDFVNRYRVAEAERKLQDPRLAHYSLVGIALESGFNSKSTFNRVFKKLTGRTPGEVTRPKS